MAATPSDSWRSRSAAPPTPAGSSAFRSAPAPAPGKGRRGGGGGRRPHTPSEAAGPDKPKPSRQNSSAGAPAAAGGKPPAPAKAAAPAAKAGAGGRPARGAANGSGGGNGRQAAKAEHHSPPDPEKRTTGRRRRASQNKGGPRPESSASKFNPPPPLTEVPLREQAKPAAHDLPPHLSKNTPPHLAQSHALFESHLDDIVRHAREGLLSATPGSGFAPSTPIGDWAADDDADELPALDDWGVHVGGSDAGETKRDQGKDDAPSSTGDLKPDWKSGLKAFSGPETSLISPIIVDGLRALPDPTETTPVSTDKGKAKDDGKARESKANQPVQPASTAVKDATRSPEKSKAMSQRDAKAAAAFFLKSAAFTSTASNPSPVHPPNTVYATSTSTAAPHPSLPVKPSAPTPQPVSHVRPAATPMRGRKDRQKEKEPMEKEKEPKAAQEDATSVEDAKPAINEAQVMDTPNALSGEARANASQAAADKAGDDAAVEQARTEELVKAEVPAIAVEKSSAATAETTDGAPDAALSAPASEPIDASPSAPSQASSSPSDQHSPPFAPARSRASTASRIVGGSIAPGHRTSPSAPQRHARAHSGLQPGHARTHSTPTPAGHRLPAARPVIASSALAGIARQLGGSPRAAAVATKQ
ncbi:hypothetical protein HDZ31DRAFT_43274 [Schizophyllum fasciatum]